MQGMWQMIFLGEILEIHLDRVDRKYTRPYTQERVQFKCNFVEDTARWYSTQRNKLYKIAKYSIFAMLVRLFWECTWLWKSQKTLISDLSQSKKQMTQKCKIYIFCFARQTIHVIVMIKNDIKKIRKNSGRTIQFKTIYSDSRT